MANFIKIIDDEIEEFAIKIKKSEESLASAEINFHSQFENVENSTIYANGIEKIDYQIKSLSNTFNKIKMSILKAKNNFFEIEKKLEKEALSLEIPTDFLINKNFSYNNFTTIELHKNNGRTISTDDNIKKIEASVIESLNSNVNFQNINKNNIENKASLDDVYDFEGKNLKSFKQNNITEFQTTQDISNVNREKLKQINKNHEFKDYLEDVNYEINNIKINNSKSEKELDKTTIEVYNHDDNN